ncbi:MAG TPA: hypothetical protein PL009_06120 [Flavipsychrobacter sp.]|nr:hypothetical protein [Flavipsychrobacter sp.]
MDRAYYQALMIVVFAVAFASCNKDDKQAAPVITEGKKTFIVCEGSYGNGNGRLDVYFSETDSLYENVYKNINGKNLGDVFQSMTWIGDKLYLAINNSDKIVVLNKDLTLSTQIAVAKPRYILPINEHKAYVSSMYTNKVFVFDPASSTVTGSVELSAINTEGMLLHNQKLYVCPWDTASGKVYVINTMNDELEDSFEVAGRAPSEVLIDKEQKLWILSGNVAKGKPAFWTRVDPNTKHILRTYSFPANADPVKPLLNSAKDSIYFIEVNNFLGAEHNGIYRMSIHDNSLPSIPFIPAHAGQYFWALAIHPNGDIYVGDPKGFTQKSSVMIYDTKGNLKKQFNTGVGVGHFYFSD